MPDVTEEELQLSPQGDCVRKDAVTTDMPRASRSALLLWTRTLELELCCCWSCHQLPWLNFWDCLSCSLRQSASCRAAPRQTSRLSFCSENLSSSVRTSDEYLE
jgi:hypothetical protein